MFQFLIRSTSSFLSTHMYYWALILLCNLLLFVKYLFHITLVGWFRFYFHREQQRSFLNILNLLQILFLCGILKLCWSSTQYYFSEIILEEFWSYSRSKVKCRLRKDLRAADTGSGALPSENLESFSSQCPADSLFDLANLSHRM